MDSYRIEIRGGGADAYQFDLLATSTLDAIDRAFRYIEQRNKDVHPVGITITVNITRNGG